MTSFNTAFVATILAALLFCGGAEGGSPVFWDIWLGPTPKEITIKVSPRIRVKDVKFEVEFLDENKNPIQSETFSFTDEKLTELIPGQEYDKKLKHNIPSAKRARGKLLYAKPSTSSPKAAVNGNVEQLEQGIPPGAQ
jgi:hypothetical protein